LTNKLGTEFSTDFQSQVNHNLVADRWTEWNTVAKYTCNLQYTDWMLDGIAIQWHCCKVHAVGLQHRQWQTMSVILAIF